MKIITVLALLLVPMGSVGHGPSAELGVEGMYIVNPTDHWHVCVIGYYQFEVAPFSQSRTYPPAEWSCY